ncbi:uncharacterized protein AB675_8737 [Cyphellophora attinorum]|uniref:pH-response transcription factor pacC/RIM101 n=1 Tax=Cyphellophora attinorum TaxID=1664694 RepID=A0A0N1HW86_9EURO|nr:uncharacterized protein AB675_8737 [Phialophora attinorum]KPI44356.1 hypothetical protein AB675_8737 [Phialophora attinorum]
MSDQAPPVPTEAPTSAIPQTVPEQSGQLAAPVAQPSSVSSAGENLQCQWQGCGERCASPELLYEHVCERHVGRKSTNNLNLTCAWGQCRTTTVKRDHITSHIRVHVPLKPHKCEFCGKAFKRPQDLKKHVKTHADDSVIMRSPEPNGGARQSQGGMPQGGNQNHSYYGHYLTGQVPQTYYAPAMPPQDYSGQHHANPYYQTHPQVQVRTSPEASRYYMPPPITPYDGAVAFQMLTDPTVQTGQHPGYGPVTYYNAPAPQATYDYETRKRGYDALDAFFGQVKRREFDPMQYQAVSRRLFELQGLQLPQIIPSSMGVPAYQPVSVGGGSYESNDPIQAYSLPPMGNAKTRGDLTSIDQILEQMQATIYENDTHMSAPGQGNTGYVAYRTSSNSPPSAQLPHAGNSPTALLQHQHQSSVASTADTASTPGLTPPSSAQSYTSGQSPIQGHSAPHGSAIYPSLPSTSGDMTYGSNNAATLGGQYDDERRHYHGGMLQRAAPAKKDEDMDMGSDGSVTPPASAINNAIKGKGRASSPKDANIDPSLGSAEVGTPKSDATKEDGETQWVQNMRLIEWMRDIIKKRLERGEYDEDEARAKEPSPDTEMTGTTKSDHEQLYPVLRHVVDDA